MPVAIEFFLDEPSAAVVRQIWKEIAEAGISSYLHTSGIRPHLTLAVGKGIDELGVEALLREWATETAPLDVTFAGLGLTPSENANVFLTAIVTADLLALHAALHARVAGLVDSSWQRYHPGRWVPHCTLAERVPGDLLGRTLEVVRRAPLPLDARLVEIAVVEFGPLRHRFSIPLTG
jgi:2'-5' RNA ligase